MFLKRCIIGVIGGQCVHTHKTSIQEIQSPIQSYELVKSDRSYPQVLKRYEGEFERLYVVGDESSLRNCIGIIGSRKATPYGIKTAQLIATWCAELGMSVVSGCARGCDQASHEGALAAGGKTVAVLGCGADVSYPANATRLLSRIAYHGAVISEYEWGSRPARYKFVQRNRLIAALSQLVIVVEAALPSGTFSTVNHAQELCVSVGAVPGSIYSPLSSGPNQLIRDGAYSITSKEDFLSVCSLEGLDGSETQMVLPVLEDDLLRALQASPLTPEEAAHYCKINVQDAVYRMNQLEVQGIIERSPGGRFTVLDYIKAKVHDDSTT